MGNGKKEAKVKNKKQSKKEKEKDNNEIEETRGQDIAKNKKEKKAKECKIEQDKKSKESENTHTKYVIEINRGGCIACGTCYYVDPVHFESSKDGKSKVVGGSTNGKSRGNIDDDEIENAKSASLACPVSVIIVTED